MTNPNSPAPKPKPPAHTELRRQPETKTAPVPPLKPRTPAERLPKSDEDGLDDLFNDMPV